MFRELIRKIKFRLGLLKYKKGDKVIVQGYLKKYKYTIEKYRVGLEVEDWWYVREPGRIFIKNEQIKEKYYPFKNIIERNYKV